MLYMYRFIGCYQPLSISETIGCPEPGLLGALSLELDENAWKSKMSENRLKNLELKRTFNEAGNAEDGKQGEDVVGVHRERCVHCLAAWS